MESSDRLYAVGVDVGATKIAAALIAFDGRVIAWRQAPTQVSRGPAAVLDCIAGEIANLLQEGIAAGEIAPQTEIQGIGIGTPGQVISDQGVVRNAVNMGWQEVHLVDEVRSRLLKNIPIWIEKDANASAVGEYYYGSALGSDNFVYLGVGSGLGGGLMVGGRLVTGSSHNAAEVGHLSLDPEGLPCACGLRGCAETVASGPGLVAAARRILESRPPQLTSEALRSQGIRLKAEDTLSAARILAAAQDGDPVALEALAAVGAALGFVASACVALLNPAQIIIGGGLGTAAFKHLEHSIGEALRRRTLAASHQALAVVPSELKSPAVGAACLVWHRLGIKPVEVQENETRR